MSEAVSPSPVATTNNGPRFRIVPGPVLGENGRANVPRSITSSASTPSFVSQVSSQDMQLRPVQYVMLNQGNNSQAQQTQMRNANAAEQASMVSKCARFFKTLIHLSQQPDQQQGQQTAVRVTELVKLVIYGSMPPEVFTSRLQEALRSQAQPHLLPFLQRTLPALRAALQKGEVIIEGIGATAPQQSPLPDIPQSSTWDTNTQRTNNENSYVAQRSSNAPQPVMINGSIGSYTKTEGSDEYSTEESSSEIEVRTLPPSQIQKIQRAMPDGGIPQDEVVAMISQAAEFRLRVMLAKLAIVAEHRLEPLRNHPYYRTIDDTRRQLRFVEELERLEYERRENREKEALIRLSKTKGKDKDTLVEKAKQLQRADQEAARNRDANAAAIAALGGGKINKSLGPKQIHRPRTKRVTMRDLQLVIAQDPISRTSQLRHRLALFNYTTDTEVLPTQMELLDYHSRHLMPLRSPDAYGGSCSIDKQRR
ncbi:Transcription initiation factor TFIID subunit 4 [Dirofilaria immitis]|nr:Transcription initiation factor TFIID subunit 4 [Dirofilaria immitis]